MNFYAKYQVSSSKMAELWQLVQKRTSLLVLVLILYIQVILRANSVLAKLGELANIFPVLK